MSRGIRLLLSAIALFQTFFAVAFYFQLPFATSLWPLPETTPLSHIFLASIFLAAAAATGWCVWVNSRGALAGIALDYIVIFVPLIVYLLQRAAALENTSGFVIALGVGVVFGGWMLIYSLRAPITDPRPMPRLVRWSFIVFTVALVIVGVSLTLKVPNVIPWRVTEDMSVVIGWMFLGAAAYFIYGLLRPSWLNTGGQLAGFLAYDIVLIVPFLQRLPGIAEEFRVSLIIYTVVVIYSGLLAIYYLFINPSTRMGSPAASGE